MSEQWSRAGRAACRRNQFVFYPRIISGDIWEQQVWVLVPERTELAAVWYSGKNSNPGWLELGEVSGHSKGTYLPVHRGMLLSVLLLGMSWM